MLKYLLLSLVLFSCTKPELTNEDSALQEKFCVKKIVDFIPALQPFVNEGCNTSWANLSAIVSDSSVTYFANLPNYTQNPNDLDKSRFTFIFQSRNPWYGEIEGETPYSHIQTGWQMLPVDDYGSMTCQGVQEIRIWVLDELTDKWYMNAQVCWAGFLCNDQVECEQGYGFDEIEYVNYTPGYLYLQEGELSLY